MRRAAKPLLCAEGKKGLEGFETYLRGQQDLAFDTVRNYLSDPRQLAAFCEATWADGEEAGEPISFPGVG